MSKYVLKRTPPTYYWYYSLNLATGELTEDYISTFPSDEEFIKCVTRSNDENIERFKRTRNDTYNIIYWPVYVLEHARGD